MDSPWFYVAALIAAPFVYRMWCKDYQAQAGGETLETALPGATPVATWITIMAVIGALVILAIEVVGEYALDVVEQQSEMTIVFAAYSVLVASVLEEMIFRGFLYVDKTRASLVASVIVMSVLFAVLHGHIWSFSDPNKPDEVATADGESKDATTATDESGATKNEEELNEGNTKSDGVNILGTTVYANYGAKGLFTTAILFLRSLWLYAMRFIPVNSRQSLIPCFMAHMVANLGVVIIKAMQGKMVLAWEA